MASIQSRFIRSLIVKSKMRPLFDPMRSSIQRIRKESSKMSRVIKVPPGVYIEGILIENLSIEHIRADNVPEHQGKAILYLHSGAFCLGYANNHREFAARLSKTSQMPVFAVDYRLAPENPYPAANEDCIAAYRWLMKNGYDAKNIILGGDSAGGGLALMTMLSLRDAGEPLPAAAFLISPLIDLIHFDGESYETRASADPLNSLEGLRMFADYFCPLATKPEALSPLNQALTGLPKLLIHVGDDEIILSDSIRLAQRAEACGVDVTLKIWGGMWHIFHGFAALVPEAKAALEEIGRYLRQGVDEGSKPLFYKAFT